MPEVKKTLFTHTVSFGLVALLYGWWNPAFIPFAYGAVLLRRTHHTFKGNDFRAWVTAVACFLAVILSLVALFNYTMDPLWCFDHDNRWNRRQEGFNERLQKTNLATFRKFAYRSLLIGSSRVAILNQNDFGGMGTFNYAAATMIPDEYGDYIRYARERNGRAFETVLIGLDFFGSNANYKKTFEEPEHYFSATNSLLYRYRMLLSFDTLRYSKNNLMSSGKNVRGAYDRANVRTPKIMSPADRESLMREQFVWFRTEGYGKNYRYDEGFKEKLRKLKRDNPTTTFTVFTTPVSKPLFCLMVRMNRLPDYERWLRDLAEVFGGFYHFMDLNSVTRDYRRTFSDCDHVYPATGALIAHRVMGVSDDVIPADFGKLVTPRNVEQIIAGIEEHCIECRK
ncbi:FUSC family protein [bacterium]|nr:FUSC family protein [bacterium]